MNDNGHKRRPRTQRDYFWVCAVEKVSQRPVVQGPHNTEREAREWGLMYIKDGDFEVLPFPTINKIAARDFYKSKMVERTKNIASAFTRAIYPKKEGG